MSSVVSKSVGRAFAVLELFGRARRPLTAKQIERELGLPQASTVVLLKELTALGLLAQSPLDRSYLPTARVAELGAWLLAGSVDRRLLGLAQRLAEATGETTSLSVREGARLRIVHVVPGATPGAILLSPGFGAPLPASGVGRVLLAQLDDAAIGAILRELNDSQTEARPARHHRLTGLLQAVGRIRRAGYGAAYDLLIPGVGVVAVAVPGAAGGEPLALAVAGPTPRIRAAERRILRLLRAAVREAGASGAPPAHARALERG